MIFKVLYQVLPHEVPVRERTKAIYVEAEDIKTVRHQLNDRDFHIEHIHALDEAHLEYEKQSESFELEKL